MKNKTAKRQKIMKMMKLAMTSEMKTGNLTKVLEVLRSEIEQSR